MPFFQPCLTKNMNFNKISIKEKGLLLYNKTVRIGADFDFTSEIKVKTQEKICLIRVVLHHNSVV